MGTVGVLLPTSTTTPSMPCKQNVAFCMARWNRAQPAGYQSEARMSYEHRLYFSAQFPFDLVESHHIMAKRYYAGEEKFGPNWQRVGSSYVL